MYIISIYYSRGVSVADISFISYDPNTGLIVKTKSEIMDSLIEIAQEAYGGSYVIDEGTEMYNLLDIISSSLTDAGNACQSVYNAFSFITAQGAPLDALVSLAGITRIQGETDTQLRARYYQFLYSQSSGTMEGLTAKIIESTTTASNVESNYIQDVRVYENYSNDSVSSGGIAWTPNGIYTIESHSILVVIKLREDYEQQYFSLSSSDSSQTQTILSEDAQALNTTIENYKSLGCGITQNNMRPNSTDTPYYFAIAMNSNLSVSINIYFPEYENYVNYHAAVENFIKNSIMEYLSNLQLGEDILFTGIMSCIYKAYDSLSVNDYIFTVGNDSTIQANNDISITGKYIGDTVNSTEQTFNLNQTNPRVIMPYTAYIDINSQNVNEKITVNFTYPQ